MRAAIDLFPRSRRTATLPGTQLPVAANHTVDMGTHTASNVAAVARMAAMAPAGTMERDMGTSVNVFALAGPILPARHRGFKWKMSCDSCHSNYLTDPAPLHECWR